MFKLRLLILLVFVAFYSNAQNTIELCVGSTHDFGVPLTSGSYYNWTINDTSIAEVVSGNGTDLIIVELRDTGFFSLTVEELDINGCKGYDSLFIQVHPLPNPIITANTTSFCYGDSVLIEVDSVYNQLLWSNNLNSEFIYANSSDNYFVNVTDLNGCSNSSDTISIVAYDNPSASFMTQNNCVNDFTMFVNTSIASSEDFEYVLWDFGEGNFLYGDSVFYRYSTIGYHDVILTVQNNIGCISSVIQNVEIFDNPDANFLYSPITISTLNPEINFLNTTDEETLSFWSFGDSVFSIEKDPTHIYNDPGIYDVILIVEDVNHCIDSITKQVIMYYDFVLQIPKAFTPNGDALNDTFGPNGLRMDKYKSYDFQIYNKWGKRVFITSNIYEWWNGSNCPEGVYQWILTITDELGKVRTDNGFVHLIR